MHRQQRIDLQSEGRDPRRERACEGSGTIAYPIESLKRETMHLARCGLPRCKPGAFQQHGQVILTISRRVLEIAQSMHAIDLNTNVKISEKWRRCVSKGG